MNGIHVLIWYTAAICAGCFFGTISALIYKSIIRPGITCNYFNLLSRDIYGLLKGEEDKYWYHYRNLVRQSLFYLGIQFLGVALALVPIIFLMVFLNGPIQDNWNRGAFLAVIPDEAGTIIYAPFEDTRRGIDSIDIEPPSESSNEIPPISLILKNGRLIKIEGSLTNYLFCREGRIFCEIMKINGFKVVSLPQKEFSTSEVIVVRPLRGDKNPFWPYLNDLDFLFLIGLSATTVILMIRWRGKKDAEDDFLNYGMRFLDYMLTWIATHNIGLMRRIGDWESISMNRKLSSLTIEKPIFISGLARSGTTILLEILAKTEGMATHLYKDFPFIFTPVLWNSFVRLFSSKQIEIERPHKDRIKITKESPDAFEEPIWQHFFPHLHDPASYHVLNSKNRRLDFEKFYVDHIKKIIIVRKGVRYLSKGNYNLTRVEFIKKIFPDAKFVIPIRHPLYHVESLVRQHKLFLGYSIKNQQVSEYLKTAGHYEFGPQRMPIVISKKGNSRIIAAWNKNYDSLGYAIQWAEIYQYVINLFKIENIAKNVHIIRYEDLCNSPQSEIDRISSFLGLTGQIDSKSAAKKISPPSHKLGLSEIEIEQCWKEVESVACCYGYDKDSTKISDDFLQSTFI